MSIDFAIDFDCRQNISLRSSSYGSFGCFAKVIDFVCRQNLPLFSRNGKNGRFLYGHGRFWYAQNISKKPVDFVSIDFAVDFWSVRLLY